MKITNKSIQIFRIKVLIITNFLLFFNSGQFVSAQQLPNGQFPQLKEVIIVYKTHFDIGDSDLARNLVHKYRTEMWIMRWKILKKMPKTRKTNNSYGQSPDGQ